MFVWVRNDIEPNYFVFLYSIDAVLTLPMPEMEYCGINWLLFSTMAADALAP